MVPVAARAFLGEQVLGLAISCETPARPVLPVYFGALPTPGTRSGFHSPQLDDADLRRFLATIRANEALVSNGFNSYFVRYGDADHASLRRFVDACRR